MHLRSQERGQAFSQGLPGALRAQPRGSLGNADDLGDVGVRQAFDVVEDEDFAKDGRKGPNGHGGSLIGLVEHDARGGAMPGRADRRALQKRLVDGRGLAAIGLSPIAAEIDGDGIGPAGKVPFPAKLIPMLDDPGDRLLGHVFGRGTVREHHVRDVEEPLLELNEIDVAVRGRRRRGGRRALAESGQSYLLAVILDR